MASRDVWSRGGGDAFRDLLAGALASLLLHPGNDRPAYFSSPWMSDFPLFFNPYRQFAGLFPEQADEPQMSFTGYLEELSRKRPVRIITVREHKVSEKFASHPRLTRHDRLQVRFAPVEYHEKGILSPDFYVEGSMNLTFSGLNINDEKIVFHSGGDSAGEAKLAGAYLEFDRFWGGLT